jgi:hypothetical protein
VPNCKTFLVIEAERKHVRRSAISTTSRRELSLLFFLHGKAPEEIHAILNETIWEHAPSHGIIKNWVAQFKRGDFSTCDAPRPG